MTHAPEPLSGARVFSRGKNALPLPIFALCKRRRAAAATSVWRRLYEPVLKPSTLTTTRTSTLMRKFRMQQRAPLLVYQQGGTTTFLFVRVMRAGCLAFYSTVHAIGGFPHLRGTATRYPCRSTGGSHLVLAQNLFVATRLPPPALVALRRVDQPEARSGKWGRWTQVAR